MQHGGHGEDDRRTPLLNNGHDTSDHSSSTGDHASPHQQQQRRAPRLKRAPVQRANTSMMLFSDRAIKEQQAADKEFEEASSINGATDAAAVVSSPHGLNSNGHGSSKRWTPSSLDVSDDVRRVGCWYRFTHQPFILSLRNPTGANRRFWNLLIVMIILWNFFAIPFRFGFEHFWTEPGAGALFLVIDYFGDIIYWLDILLLFHTPYFDDGFYVTDQPSIIRHYMRGWFAIDLIGTLPLDMLHFGVWQHALLRLPRMLRIGKWGYYFRIWEHFASNGGFAHALQFIKLLLGLFMVTHWWGCLYIAIGYSRGFGATNWLPHAEIQNATLPTQYLYSVSWASNYILERGGAPRRPTDDFERGLTLVICLSAIVIEGIIVGQIVELVAELSATDEHFREKMHELNMFMRHRRLPEGLQKRITRYYHNIWSRMGGLDTQEILEELPPAIKNEVHTILNQDLIQKVPLFATASHAFIEHLIEHLEPQIYSPGDRIIQSGDIGSEMYFIRRGTVEVIAGNGEVVATMRDGAYFGEIALLEENCRRTASIVASAFCDLFVLEKESLEEVLKTFPEQRHVMHEIAASRRSRDLLRTSLCEDPLFEHSGDAFLKALTEAFTKVASTRCDNAENDHDTQDIEWLFDTTMTADTVYFLGRGHVELSIKSGPLVAMERSGQTTSTTSDQEEGKASDQTEGFIGVLAAGSFFGEIGPHNYGISARIIGGMDETILFMLHRDALERIQAMFPAEAHATFGFVRRLRHERDYHKDKNRFVSRDHTGRAATIPLGFISATKLIARATRPSANGSKPRNFATSVGASNVAASFARKLLSRTSRAKQAAAAVSSSSSSNDGQSMAAAIDAALPSPIASLSAPSSSSVVVPITSATAPLSPSSNSTLVDAAPKVGNVMKLRLAAVLNSINKAGVPSVKNPFLNRIGALNTLAADKDIAGLTNEELVIAGECVSILTSKIRLLLYARSNARQHGYALLPVPATAPPSNAPTIAHTTATATGHSS